MQRSGERLEVYRNACGEVDDSPLDGCERITPLPRWSYSGRTGPEHWGDLDPRFAAAKTGRQQSPVDLTGPFQPGAETVFFTYQAAPLTITNNGCSIQVDLRPGSSISFGGRRYELLQYHFHTPSEHTLDGGFYEMELHLVHQDEDGRFAVVGIFMATGNAHPALREIWDLMPTHVGKTVSSDLLIDPSDFLPGNRRCVQYDGSLTTPPCTEGVAWIVMLEPIQASAAQIEQLEQLVGSNSRPVQPRNNRVLRAG